jgi:hypothetical protein
MHTLAKNQHHNSRLCYDFLEEAYPNGMPSFDQLVQDNIVNGTQLVELAIAKRGGLDFCPVGYNQDFLDGSDVKTVTMSKDTSIKRVTLKTGQKKRYKSTVYVAKISDVDKKIGVLRIVCWNPFAEKYQYFRIPPSAIYGISKLKISFDSKTFEPVGIYKKFEVASFEEVSDKLSKREMIDTIISNVSKENVVAQVDQLIGLALDVNDINNALDSIKNRDVVLNFKQIKQQQDAQSH